MTDASVPESRQVRRHLLRQAATVAASIAAGRKYPETKYRPAEAVGKRYSSNGVAETTRRAARFS